MISKYNYSLVCEREREIAFFTKFRKRNFKLIRRFEFYNDNRLAYYLEDGCKSRDNCFRSSFNPRSIVHLPPSCCAAIKTTWHMYIRVYRRTRRIVSTVQSRACVTIYTQPLRAIVHWLFRMHERRNKRIDIVWSYIKRQLLTMLRAHQLKAGVTSVNNAGDRVASTTI